MKVRHVGIGVSVTIQAVVCLYCCLVAYLLADLPWDDAVAVGMDSAAWNWMAATRFGLGAVVGVAEFLWTRPFVRRHTLLASTPARAGNKTSLMKRE